MKPVQTLIRPWHNVITQHNWDHKTGLYGWNAKPTVPEVYEFVVAIWHIKPKTVKS